MNVSIVGLRRVGKSWFLERVSGARTPKSCYEPSEYGAERVAVNVDSIEVRLTTALRATECDAVIFLFDENRNTIKYALREALSAKVPYVFVRMRPNVAADYSTSKLVGEYYSVGSVESVRLPIIDVVYSRRPRPLKRLAAQACGAFRNLSLVLPTSLVTYVELIIRK